MNNKENTKVIFTDTYKTKELIWTAYEGYIQNYHNYQMYRMYGRIDPIIVAGLNKYSNYMYNEIKDFFDDFKKELGEKDRKTTDDIFKKEKITFQDYTFLRSFFAKFMRVSGIKNIIREKENRGDSILNNR